MGEWVGLAFLEITLSCSFLSLISRPTPLARPESVLDYFMKVVQYCFDGRFELRWFFYSVLFTEGVSIGVLRSVTLTCVVYDFSSSLRSSVKVDYSFPILISKGANFWT